MPADRHGLPCLASVLAVAVLAVPAMGAKPPQPQSGQPPAVAMAREAFVAGRYQEAREMFERALAAQRASGSSRLESDLLFYLGLTAQSEAQGAADLAERTRLLREAAERYEAALAVEPKSGPSLNNLAQVYAATGRPDEAAALFERALALGDERRPQYAKHYAGLLASRGDSAAALRYYRMAADAQPGDLGVHRVLLRLYGEHAPAELAGYLWSLLDRGLADRAQEAALEALARPERPAAEREELLALVVASLARQFYVPDGFEKTAAGSALAELDDEEVLEDGVRQLRRLHTREVGEVEDYDWWAERGSADAAPRGLWPRDAFRRLATSLGAWYKRPTRTADPERAEAYLRLALELDPAAPDPKALLELADLYYTAGKREELDRLSREVMPRLLEAKGAAYAQADQRSIFDLHRALGVIYARLERWGDEQDPTSAIFQLERARLAAERYNESAPRPTGRGSETLGLEPSLVSLLARGYATSCVDLLRLGKAAEAKTAFEKALALDPDLAVPREAAACAARASESH